MKKQIVYWFGLGIVLSLLLSACSGTTTSPQMEEPTAKITVTEEPTVESVVTEQPASTEEETATAEPTVESVVTEQPVPTEEETVTSEPTPRRSPLTVAEDFTLPDNQGNMVNLSDELQENEQVVLVFYYGIDCTPCMAQLSEIENDRAKYEEKGAQVMAIAVHGELTAERSAEIIGAQFPILADSERSVAEAFGVLEDGGLSTPSVFVIDQDLNIVWSEISHIEGYGCGKERVPSETILENLG